jgi:hypothetical protein
MEGLEDGREWCSFEDPDEDRTWLFDLTFLTSAWTCIYGRGCPGIVAGGAAEEHIGCCSHGAWIVDDDDLERVAARAADLGPQEWQHHALARRRGGALYRDRRGDWRTRLVDGACIFLNRPGFGTGPGCALHHAALGRGESFVDWKPEVCWQIPLRREDHETASGHLYTLVREWQRRDWGGDDQDVAWWCVGEAEAFVGGRPVYLALHEELVAICGRSVYDELARRIGERDGGTFLPHPTVRARRV